MQYVETQRPPGHGLCSDDNCPCPDVTIPRRTGYLYISHEFIDFHRSAARRRELRGVGARVWGTGPILVCEQGAKLRRLDLQVAAADAKHWWKTGQVPLRATPTYLRPLTDQEIELVRRLRKREINPAHWLPRIGGVAALDALIDLLVNGPVSLSKNPVLYQNIIGLLGEIGDARAAEPLMSKYRQYDYLASEPAEKLPEELRVDHLVALRSQIIDALAKLEDEETKELLSTVLEQATSSRLRRHAAFALGRLGDPRAIDELGRLLETQATARGLHWRPGFEETREAIDLLHAIPDPRARHALVDFHTRCTDRSKRELRNHAAAKLGLPVKNPACFIATAACGSPYATEVTVLRQFRDQHLLRHRAGRAVVRVYEGLSPPLADFIRPRPWCRAAVRALILRPAVFLNSADREHSHRWPRLTRPRLEVRRFTSSHAHPQGTPLILILLSPAGAATQVGSVRKIGSLRAEINAVDCSPRSSPPDVQIEVAPPFDPSGNTALVAATLMYELLCVLAEARTMND